MTPRTIVLLRLAHADRIDWPVLAAALGPQASLARVVPPPANVAYRPPSDPQPERSADLYDAVLTSEGHGPLPAIPAEVIMFHAYAVESRTLFDRGVPHDPASAITLTGRLMFHADLPDSAARRSWSLHAPLAERVHIGADRYIQNWVTDVLTPDSPPTRGLPELRFPDESALVDRFFDSDRGRDEILQDTAHFVASGPRLYLRNPLSARSCRHRRRSSRP
jgi:hypothetical protein